MHSLAIDIETYSSADLMKSGVYRYVEAPDFQILLFAYAIDDSPTKIIDLVNGEQIPDEVLTALYNPKVLKTAYNAAFERACIAKHLQQEQAPIGWECTMARASMLGLPLGLDAVSKVLKLQTQKDAAGKALIKYFSVPCKPTKVNGMRTRNMPEHNPEKWEAFKNYCVRDVDVEQEIRRKTAFFSIPQTEVKLWQLDQRINDTGVLLDSTFVQRAICMDVNYREKLFNEAVQLTKLSNPNSAAQLKQWISTETGEEVNSLTKEAMPALLQATDCDVVKRVLRIRQEMAKTSVKKYEAMSSSICRDSRVRGLLQYYGANRTGRWAGRLVQVQNLPQNHLRDLDLARALVRDGNTDMVEILFGNVPDTLSQLIRTAFVAAEGHRLIVADFSAIEARVIAWLAGEKWRLDVFATHGKIYEASASQMFKIPIEQITKGSDLRQKGKVAELALGYQGGPNALITMGALKMGLDEEELPKLVAMWRNANRAIVKFWDTVGNAALNAVENSEVVHIQHGLKFLIEKGILFIELPSKRRLAYLRPKIKINRFGNSALTYEGMNQTIKQWESQETYGGKLVENIVQAVARDCLADAMLRVHDAGYKIIMHVHDEIVLEMPEGKGSPEEVNKIMGSTISWARGLPLRADSYETKYYRKD